MTRRPRLLAAVLLALAFVTGGLTGMVLEEALGLDWFDFLDEEARPAEAQLLRGLDLTPAQQERIDRILEDQQLTLEEYWRARLPEMRALVSRSHDQIRNVLTPDQRALFDERVERLGLALPHSRD